MTKSIVNAAKVLLAPIGFREVLLLGGTVLVGIGCSMIFPGGGCMASGAVLISVAVFGVRSS